MLRRTLSFILLIAFVFNCIGYSVAYQALKYRVKCEVKRQINSGNQMPDADCEMIELSKDEFGKRVDIEGNELEYGGHVYDILKVNFQEGRAMVYCYDDESENRINTSYLSLTAEKGGEAKSAMPLKQMLKNIVKDVVELFPVDEQVANESGNEFTTIKSNYCFSKSEVPTQPPRNTF